jgi:hypothetical protein
MSVYVQGVFLYPSTDYTFSGGIITFLNAVWNENLISIQYFTVKTNGFVGALRYSTTVQLARILGVKRDVPSWEVAASPSKEEVGTGDNSNLIFYLDYRNIIDGTYTLYYGSVATTTTTLTETTHYTLDLTTGKITLTTAGRTLLSTSKIFAEYSYYGVDLTDAYFEETLLRAEQEVDDFLNTTFTDGTADNPDYPAVTEYHATKGQWDLSYFTRKRPVIDIVSSLGSSLTINASTLSVATGDGVLFPVSGYIIIGEEIISYTGVSSDTLTGLTRAALGSTAAAHDSGDAIHTTTVSISGTHEGSTPTWTALPWESDVVVSDIGKIYIYDAQITSDVSSVNATLLARPDVEKRLRITYLHGYDTVPTDITRLTLILAKRALIADTVGASLFKGRNEFNPEMFNADQEEMRRIERAYGITPIDNT